MKPVSFALIRDIRFWLAILFLARLIGITHPPLDAGHGWRQAQTCMIARNLLETDNNPFFPRIDQAGADKTGIVGSEFPVFQYLIYLVSLIFGYDHWYGRLINLVFTTMGLWYFYRLLADRLNERTAFFSAILLSVSVWFMFGRKMMPDTFSVSLVFAALWAASKYISTGKRIALVLFFLLATLGGLAKLPAAIYLAAIPALWFDRQILPVRKWLLFFLTGLSSLVILCWYFIWVPHLVETYGFQIMFVQNFREGFYSFFSFWPLFLQKIYFETTQSYAVFALVLTGWVFAFRNNRPLFLFISWMLVPILFFFLKAGGTVISNHNYYMIPLAPIFAVMAGWALQTLGRVRLEYALLVVCAVEGLANQQHDLRLPASRMYKMQLESLVDQYSVEGTGIALVCDQNPTEFYCAHRKGWMLWPEDVSDFQKMSDLAQKGCSLLIINRHNYPDVKADLPEVYRNEDYILYRFD